LRAQPAGPHTFADETLSDPRKPNLGLAAKGLGEKNQPHDRDQRKVSSELRGFLTEIYNKVGGRQEKTWTS